MSGYKPLDEADRDQIKANIATIEELGAAIGDEWTSKVDGRQTGFSLHIKFGRKTDVMTALKFAHVMENAAGMYLATAARLLEADAALRGDA